MLKNSLFCCVTFYFFSCYVPLDQKRYRVINDEVNFLQLKTDNVQVIQDTAIIFENLVFTPKRIVSRLKIKYTESIGPAAVRGKSKNQISNIEILYSRKVSKEILDTIRKKIDRSIQSRNQSNRKAGESNIFSIDGVDLYYYVDIKSNRSYIILYDDIFIFKNSYEKDVDNVVNNFGYAFLVDSVLIEGEKLYHGEYERKSGTTPQE